MPRRRDVNTGKYEQVYSSEQIKDLLQGTRLGTSEVAEELGCHRTTAHDRLHQLKEEGVVTWKQVGNTQVWSLTDSHSEE